VKKRARTKEKNKNEPATRFSPRLKNNICKRKAAIKLAQEVLAKKWGILRAKKELEDITL
jgi:hypothetical protein